MRHLQPGDFEFVNRVVDAWWGDRPVRHLLPRLFFEHFADTGFALPGGEGLLGFLVGFRSQTHPEIAYIHFVGVDPACRGRGLGRSLYNTFFGHMRRLGCTTARCITSPSNTGSVAFHRSLGFSLVPSPWQENGFPVSPDYYGPGQARVLFTRAL